MNVANFAGALQGISTTTLRAVIGDILLDDVLSKREQINEVLRTKLDEQTERWGGKVTTVEIREIIPPRDVQDAMNRMLSAERNRRAVITESEGARQSAINVAEGAKQAAILQAEGERQAAILRAEGFSEALQRIFSAAKDIDDRTMALQYLDALKDRRQPVHEVHPPARAHQPGRNPSAGSSQPPTRRARTRPADRSFDNVLTRADSGAARHHARGPCVTPSPPPDSKGRPNACPVRLEGPHADGPLRTHAAERVVCPVCEGQFSSFMTRHGHRNAQCPRCVRWYAIGPWLYLRDVLRVGQKPSRLLHLAPEQGIKRRLRALPAVDYVTADLNAALAADRVDVVSMPYPDASFDLVVCSHVLEHVPDDRRAIRELYRVLRPGRTAIVVVPIRTEHTEEFLDLSPSPAYPDGYLRVGAHAHVREIGADTRSASVRQAST